MYKKYVKKTKLEAVEYKDDFEVYKFIAKEVGWYTDLAETEEEYTDEVKRYGIGLKGTESSQRLFIGDYLANAGNGDFYVIRKEFMEENYELSEEDEIKDYETAVEKAIETRDALNNIILDSIERVQEKRFLDGLAEEFVDAGKPIPRSILELGALLKCDTRPRLLERNTDFSDYSKLPFMPDTFTVDTIGNTCDTIVNRKEHELFDWLAESNGIPKVEVTGLDGEVFHVRKDFNKNKQPLTDEWINPNLLHNSFFTKGLLEKWSGNIDKMNCMPPRDYGTILDDKTMVDPAPNTFESILKPKVYHSNQNGNVSISDLDPDIGSYMAPWLKTVGMLTPVNGSTEIDIQVLDSVDVFFSEEGEIIIFKYNFKNTESGSNSSINYPILINNDIDIDKLFSSNHTKSIDRTTDILKMYLNEVIKLALCTVQQLPDFVDVRINMNLKNAPHELRKVDLQCVSFVLTEDTLNKLNNKEKENERIND